MLFSAKSTLLMAVGASAAAVQESYDYVIVGGGTAGNALAARLSNGLPNAQILVLEAGPSALDEIRINIPGMRGSILGSEYDWNFTSIPQASLEGRSIDVNRGRVLGGSSAMNYLCYDRAAAAEYDAWGELGSSGWNWKSMIAGMTKSENFTGNDGDVHGTKGPIKTSYSRIIFDALKPWQKTLNKLGVKTNDGGSLGGKPLGVMFQPTNINVKDHTRSYSANSYLPIAGKNLKVKTNSPVAKLNFATRSGQLVATGVTLQDGSSVTAKKEVILSSGSIGSPQLLELSGVGQSAILKKAGIKQVLELPGVGENYQDHLRTSNTYRLKDGFESFDPLIYDNQGPVAAEQLQLWFDNKVSWFDYTSSAYSFLNWAQIGSTISTEMVALAKKIASATGATVIDKKKYEHIKDSTVPQIELLMDANYVGAAGYPGGKFITIFSTVMRPFSRGSTHINPASPAGKPLIDLKFLSNEFDLRAVAEGAKLARKVANTEPLRSVWEAETEPGPEVTTDAQFRDFAVKTVNSFYHPLGTCAMLPKKDGGVVDANLKVYGVANLRVVDASIIPIQMSGHIQTAVYGIAEVAAQKIISAA